MSLHFASRLHQALYERHPLLLKISNEQRTDLECLATSQPDDDPYDDPDHDPLAEAKQLSWEIQQLTVDDVVEIKNSYIRDLEKKGFPYLARFWFQVMNMEICNRREINEVFLRLTQAWCTLPADCYKNLYAAVPKSEFVAGKTPKNLILPDFWLVSRDIIQQKSSEAATRFGWPAMAKFISSTITTVPESFKGLWFARWHDQNHIDLSEHLPALLRRATAAHQPLIASLYQELLTTCILGRIKPTPSVLSSIKSLTDYGVTHNTSLITPEALTNIHTNLRQLDETGWPVLITRIQNLHALCQNKLLPYWDDEGQLNQTENQLNPCLSSLSSLHTAIMLSLYEPEHLLYAKGFTLTNPQYSFKLTDDLYAFEVRPELLNWLSEQGKAMQVYLDSIIYKTKAPLPLNHNLIIDLPDLMQSIRDDNQIPLVYAQQLLAEAQIPKLSNTKESEIIRSLAAILRWPTKIWLTPPGLTALDTLKVLLSTWKQFEPWRQPTLEVKTSEKLLAPIFSIGQRHQDNQVIEVRAIDVIENSINQWQHKIMSDPGNRVPMTITQSTPKAIRTKISTRL